uniref:Insulin receptor substrate 1 n=1 Tax=Timema douglasi TaxID=61478 RepID=A0A7R8ZAQ8_TIMDO|nr:unnamed protein product [Timema douglasi]
MTRGTGRILDKSVVRALAYQAKGPGFDSHCLHLQLYRDSKDRYKQGQTKASLSLQHFLGYESGFTLDKESNTIAIICQDVTVILAFDTRERLIQWQVKISNNLGEDFIGSHQSEDCNRTSKAPCPRSKILYHSGRTPKISGILGDWKTQAGYIMRYGVVEGRFCFEGGSRCGRGEGLHVCVTDQGEEITHTFQLAAQGKLATRRRPASRKASAMDSPRRQLSSRAEMRMSEGFMETFQQQQQQLAQLAAGDLNRSLYGEDTCCGCSMGDSAHESSRHQSSEDLICPCRSRGDAGSPFWSSVESTSHHHTDLDSNYGCGDTASVSDILEQHHHHPEPVWPENGAIERRVGPTSLERCASCIGKLGGPSMSRSSTATTTNTPNTPFSPAWTMDSVPSCQHHVKGVCRVNTTGASSSGGDRASLSSHGSSGNSEYSVPSVMNIGEKQTQCWCERPSVATNAYIPSPPIIPPKVSMPANISVAGTNSLVTTSIASTCRCHPLPPVRPPKPLQIPANTSIMDSPTNKKTKKPPMPLPSPPIPTCMCHQLPINIQQQRTESSSNVGPYENYDVPRSILGLSYSRDQKEDDGEPLRRHSFGTNQDEYYDTPKNVLENLSRTVVDISTNPHYGNYDVPPAAMTVRKPCGCIIKYAKKSTMITTSADSSRKIVDREERNNSVVACPCQRMMCWAENWMMLPYCRRGNGIENTGVPIHKVKLSGEGKMPVVNPSGEIAIYATVDKSKKINKRPPNDKLELETCECLLERDYKHKEGCETCTQKADTSVEITFDLSNYENIDPNGNVPNIDEGEEEKSSPKQSECGSESFNCLNYENIDFAHSLEYYENSRDLLSRAGISQKDMDSEHENTWERDNLDSGKIVSYTITDGVKVCNKCGHTCHIYVSETPQDSQSTNTRNTMSLSQSEDAATGKQDDYLMMEPGKSVEASNENIPAKAPVRGNHFPGYLPMSPITNACSKPEMLKAKFDYISKNLYSEKSASTPSLTGPVVDRSRKRSDTSFPRIPGSAMMMMHHSVNSPYLRRHLLENSDDKRKHNFITRKRSSSADSSVYNEEYEEPRSRNVLEEIVSISSRVTQSSQNSVNNQTADATNNPSNPNEVSNGAHMSVNKKVNVHENVCHIANTTSSLQVEEAAARTITLEENTSISSCSLRTLTTQGSVVYDQKQSRNSPTSSAAHIRRSSSVPCKSGNNRDSSSSNDSGVSIDSLRHRGTDFAEFELPLTNATSARRHYQSLSRYPGILTNCIHSSLPRRSKSVDPLRELSFQFQKVKIPAKSSSAEAEVPICSIKEPKGFASPGADSATVVPYIDSRSTSSGTSDMSDYIETLSLSSHSSSDTTAESLRLGRPATTLRPRSGKEYQLIDRYILDTDAKGGQEKISHQQKGMSQYSNIPPVLEKSESPSPGYMSGSPGQEREDPMSVQHTFSK